MQENTLGISFDASSEAKDIITIRSVFSVISEIKNIISLQCNFSAAARLVDSNYLSVEFNVAKDVSLTNLGVEFAAAVNTFFRLRHGKQLRFGELSDYETD